MKLSYFPDTDSHYSAAGQLVGIDIDEASKRVEPEKLSLSR